MAWRDKIAQKGVDDMTLLSKIDESSVAHNLRERFENDVIYTNIGDVLISMNPFKWILSIFGDEMIREYEGRSRIEMPPHIYAIAEDSYRSMMTEKENQCVIISGESGAGKVCSNRTLFRLSCIYFRNLWFFFSNIFFFLIYFMTDGMCQENYGVYCVGERWLR
jgi:myosin heavy subunit